MSYAIGPVFADIIHDWIGRGEPAMLGRDIWSPAQLTDLFQGRAKMIGLDIQSKDARGHKLELREGAVARTLERHRVYALASLDDARAAMVGLANYIASTHGPGRVWFTGKPGYLNRRDAPDGFVDTRIQGTDNSDRDEPYVFTPTGDGSRRVVLGAYYFHDPEPVAKHDPELERLMLDLNKHEHEVTVPNPYTSLTKDAAGDLYFGGAKLTTGLVMPVVASDWYTLRDQLKREAFESVGATAAPPAPVYPLDVEYDGVSLREMLARDEADRREGDANFNRKAVTPAQRAAVSAHWSAQLRAKVEATKAADAERERTRVVVDFDEYD